MEDVSEQAKEEPVTRLEAFRAKHPEIAITPPSIANGPYWEAVRDGLVIADAYWLEWFLDKLEKLT